MSLTYPLSLPSLPTPQQVVLGEVDIVGMNQSPFNAAQEVQDWGNQYWTAKLTWSRISTRAKAAPLRAVMRALRGAVGTILIGDPLGKMPQGSAASAPGTPVVNGAVAVRATQLPLRGLPVSVTGYLRADDYLQLGSGETTRLYTCLGDVNTDGSGHATIDIWPFLREAYGDGTAVTLTNCVGTFRLIDPKREWSLAPASSYAAELNFIEKL